LSTNPNTLQSQDSSSEAQLQPVTYEVTPEGYVISLMQQQEDESTKAEFPLASFELTFVNPTVATEVSSTDASRLPVVLRTKTTTFELTFVQPTIATEVASTDASTRPSVLRTLKYITYALQFIGAVVTTQLNSADSSRAVSLPPVLYVISFGQPTVLTKNVIDVGQFIDRGGLLRTAYDFGLGSDTASVVPTDQDSFSSSSSESVRLPADDSFSSLESITERDFNLYDANRGIDALYKPSEDATKIEDRVYEKDMSIIERIMQLDYVGLRRFFLRDLATGTDALYKEDRDEAELADTFRPPVIVENESTSLVEIENFVVHQDEDIGTGIDALYKPSEDSGAFVEREYDVVLYQRSVFRASDRGWIELSLEEIGKGIDALYKEDSDLTEIRQEATVVQRYYDLGFSRQFVVYREFRLRDTGPSVEGIYRGVFEHGYFSSTEEANIKENDKGAMSDSVTWRLITERDEGTFTDSAISDLGKFRDMYGLVKLPTFIKDIGYRNAVYAIHSELERMRPRIEACRTEPGALITSSCINSLVETVVKLSLDVVFLLLGSLRHVAPLDYTPMNSLNDLLSAVFSRVRIYNLEG